jgi:hypothetical protein
MAITDSLIAYWELNEASGTRNDSHGANHLADNNTVTQAVGRIGSAAQFTAANSEYLSIADNTSLSTGDIDFTFQAWIYIDSTATHRGVAGKFAASGNREWYLSCNPGGALRFVVSPDIVTYGDVSSAELSPARWYHVVTWHDSVNNIMGISVNDGAPVTASYSGGAMDSTAPFFLGDSIGSGFPFEGRIDNAGFWKRVLRADERTALYNQGVGRSYAALTQLKLTDNLISVWTECTDG